MKRLSILNILKYKTFFLFVCHGLALEASTNVEWEQKAQEELSESITIQEQHSLCNLLKEYVLQADPTVSEVAYNCYEKIQNGMNALSIAELAELLPELITYAQTKAPRVDAPQITSPSAIAGDTCDLTEVLRLLGIIRSRIGNVFQDPSALTVLSTLGNPLELGPGLNIVRKLLRIQEEFRETWTILGEINSTVTACCAILEQDFRETWTVLADLSTTLTTCCAEIQGTFTALEACCNSTFTQLNALNILITNDFNQTWTILADIDTTLTQCCAVLEQDFQETWTILAEITDTLTSCCGEIHGTFTALEACCNSTFTQLDALSILITNDFNQTWTILADINATLTQCCQILQQDFQETWTILAGLTVTASVDFSEVFTALADIDVTLTQCCSALEQNFQATWTILGELTLDLNNVFTVLADTCDTAITITGPMTITQPGTYCLMNDISGTIIIAADQVFLDLNQKEISSPEDRAIQISGQRDIEIKNGSIRDCLDGVLVTTVTNLFVFNITFASNQTAINISNSLDLFVTRCFFNENLNDTSAGIIEVNNVNNVFVKKCFFENNTFSVGISFSGCNTMEVSSTVFSNNISNSSLWCITTFNSASLIIRDCEISNNNSENGNDPITIAATTPALIETCVIQDCSAVGIFRGINIDSGVIIRKCVISNNTSTTSSIAGISAATDTTIDRCIIERNVGTTASTGIVLGTTGCVVTGNQVLFNISVGTSTGILTAVGSNVFLTNISQGHTDNYDGVPTPIIAILDSTTGIYSSGPQPYDNISVVVP